MIFALLLLAAAPADDAFTPWLTKDGVAIARTTTAGTPWIRGTKTVGAPCENVEKVLVDWDSYAKTFAPVVKRAKVLGKGDGFARLHLVWPYPWPMWSRDAIVRYEVAHEGTRTTIRWLSDEKPGDPKTTGVRITRAEGGTTLTPDGAKCALVYTYYGDLGGNFGKSSSEKAWKGQPPHYFESLEKALNK